MSILTDIENFFTKALHAFVHLFVPGGPVETALKTAASLAPIALPIVQEIAILVPNKTVDEVLAAYTKYGVPVVGQINADPTSVGNAMLNLATVLLSQKLPAGMAGAATSLLNTAVQLAVLALKNQKPATA